MEGPDKTYEHMDEADVDILLGEARGPNCHRANEPQLVTFQQHSEESAPRSLFEYMDDDDEGYSDGASSPTPSSMTIDSSVQLEIWENERYYPSYGRYEYGLPIDADEQKRMELQHEKHKLVLGRHYLAPVGPTPQRILDLATGTGLWPIEVADHTPSAQVIGVDISPIAPTLVPPNCSFEIDDIERTWSWPKDSFDFIHLREPLYCIRDWNKLFRQIYTHLKPGGWVEIACTHMRPVCKDGKDAVDSEFTRMCDLLMQASEIFGTSLTFPPQLANSLRNKGFINIAENVYDVPTTPYATTEVEQKIGLLEMLNLEFGAPSIGLRIMERTFGWSKEQTEVSMRSFKKDARGLRRGVYFQ
jgi:SAM-dependent methyltransferase